MKDVAVSKSTLLERLYANRESHKKMFQEALEGFCKAAEAALKLELKRLKEGKPRNVFVHTEVPVDQTVQYNRVIEMIEMSLGDTVMLSEQDFKQYVMDDWTWSREWLHKNQQYGDTVLAALSKYGE